MMGCSSNAWWRNTPAAPNRSSGCISSSTKPRRGSACRTDVRAVGGRFQGERAMGLRDSAIVAYAETKVMEKSDRDVWVLSGEILEELLDETGIDKNEIDGLVMAGLTGTGAGNPLWAQTTADVLELEVGFCEQVHIRGSSAAGSVARAAAAIDYGMCGVACLLFSDTHVLEDRTAHSHSYRREWTDPYGLMGPPGAFGLLSRRYEAQYGLY